MRHLPIDSKLFTENRDRLRKLLPPKSVAIVNANDILPMNSDAVLTIVPNSDLFYLSGIEQEESILLICPDASEEKYREVLFVREPNEHLKIWEGYKHSKEDAQKISGIKRVSWLSDFKSALHFLMCEMDHVYLNLNEHKRAVVEVETRDMRFVKDLMGRYPLQDFCRLAPLMHQLRIIKSPLEVELMQKACDITEKGFRDVCKFVKPGVGEHEVEAVFAHTFLSNRGKFAYNPIIGSGENNCVLHYLFNDQICKKGDLLLLDVGASYANYNADMTRTIPVSGKFTPRQKQVYNAVLRVFRASVKNATVGKMHSQWQKDTQAWMNEELLKLDLIKPRDIKKQTADEPACRKYYMHGLGHPLGLDVHDVGFTTEPFAPGWVITVEPGIYIPEEGFGVRLENDILITENGNVDLMANIPIEIDEIEELMHKK